MRRLHLMVLFLLLILHSLPYQDHQDLDLCLEDQYFRLFQNFNAIQIPQAILISVRCTQVLQDLQVSLRFSLFTIDLRLQHLKDKLLRPRSRMKARPRSNPNGPLEEDNLTIELRGQGMKWDDIAKRLPGRSSISCRLRYQKLSREASYMG